EGIEEARELSQTEGTVKLGVDLLITSHHSEIEAEELMCGGIPRIELNCPLEFSFSRQEVVVINGGIGQRGVGFGQAMVHFDRPLCQLPRFVATFTRGHKSPRAKCGEASGQSCVGGGIGGILRASPLELWHRSSERCG